MFFLRFHLLLNYTLFFSYFQLNQSILMIVYIECYRLQTLTIYSCNLLFFSPFLRHPTLQAEPFCLFETRLCFNRFKPLMLATHLKRLNFSIFCFFSRQTVFFDCEHPFTDKPMVKTEPAIASARLSSNNTIITGDGYVCLGVLL